MNTVNKMIEKLKKNPDVTGIISYGTDHSGDNYETGDVDLIVIMSESDDNIDSLHFHTNNVPVDLNFISLQEIAEGNISNEFHRTVVIDGEIEYDTTGKLNKYLEKIRKEFDSQFPVKLSVNDIAEIRHGQKHVLDKIRGCDKSMPAFCNFMLNTNIYWLIESYFRVRELPYKGEKNAFEYIKNNEKDIYGLNSVFYETINIDEKTDITKRLTDLILQPVNGIWKDDELLVFGNDECDDLHERGKKLFYKLFKINSIDN